jgi:glycosyltransferase involved in cell wall biosynthesis
MLNKKEDIKFCFVVFLSHIDYIKECLDSLINQSYKNFEIIIIGHKSIDKTLTIAKSYANKYKYIKIIEQYNTDNSEAKNIGLSNVKADYVLFVNGNDFVQINLLEELTKSINNLGVLDIIIFDFFKYTKKQVSKKVIEIKKLKSQKLIPNIIYNNTLNDKQVLLKSSYTAINKCFNVSFLQKNNITFLNNALYEDISFFWQTTLLSKKVLYINKSMYCFREKINKEKDIKKQINSQKSILAVFSAVNNFLVSFKLFNIYKNLFINTMLKTFVNVLAQSNNKKEFFVQISNFIQYINLTKLIFNINLYKLFEYYLIKKRQYILWRILYKWF